MSVLVFYLFLIFVYFWPCRVFIASRGLSLVAASTGDTLYCCVASHCDGFSRCRAGTRGERASVVVAVGPGAQAQ